MSKIKEALKKLKPEKRVPKEKPPKEKKARKKREKKKRERKPNDLNFKKLLNNKKLVIPMAVLLVFILGVVIVGSLGGDQQDIITADNPPAGETVEAPVEEPGNIVEEPVVDQVAVDAFIDTNVITYTFDGNVYLNNTAVGILDKVNLSEIDFTMLHEFNGRGGSPEALVEPVAEVMAEGVEEIEEVVENVVKGEDVITPTRPVYILEEPVETEYKIYKSDGESLIFGDIKRGMIFEVGEFNGIIGIYKILEDTELNLEEVYDVVKSGEEYFIAHGTEIIVFNRFSDYLFAINADSILTQEFGVSIKDDGRSINFVEYVQSRSHLYFAVENMLFRCDLSILDDELETEEDLIAFLTFDMLEYIDLGDSISDLFVYNEKVYAVNEFGFNTDNSILMRIGENENKELVVEDIMELKGIYSRPIGMHDSKVYVRQSEYIKEVDLEMFTPEKAYTRTAGIPVIVDGGYVYTIVDGVLNVSSLMDRSNPIRSIEIEGDTLYRGPILQ